NPDSGFTPKHIMTAEWEKIRERLNAVADRLDKKYIFMEIGCRSAKGCSAMPWDFAHKDLPFDEEEQADFYESCLDVFMKEERFAGVFWWDWSTFIYDTAEKARNDCGFNIHLKKAELVIKEKYGK
ncbi:MAG: glycosyl hydrolase family 53, partial [Oscillospiraceae bacterium]|nr:glycosyl hydrolase family 53 [Oscillospiraceae bacterium]